MAQWWRICLPMQETQVRSLIQEDPTCGRATKPMCHNYWACAPEPENHNYWVCSQQLLKLAPPRACAPQQEQWEAYVPQLDSSPGSPPLEKSPRSNKDPTKTKINKQHCLKKKKKGNSSQWGGEFMSLEAEKPKLLLTLWLNSWDTLGRAQDLLPAALDGNEVLASISQRAFLLQSLIPGCFLLLDFEAGLSGLTWGGSISLSSDTHPGWPSRPLSAPLFLSALQYLCHLSQVSYSQLTL